MSANQERNSTFELLRLILMFMIVLEHSLMVLTLHNYEPLSVIDNISWFIEAFTYCAVNVFFLITGYFAQDSVKLGRILKIWLETIMYSMGIYLLAVLLGKEALAIKNLVSYACPVLFKKYWFIQTYIVLAILSPYIIKGLKTLSQKAHLTLICILLIFFSIHQTFIKVNMTLDTTQGYGIIWAVVLLIVGNYIHRYGDEIIKKTKTGIFALGYVVVAVCVFISNCLVIRFNIGQGVTSRANFYAYNSISMFVESIMLFCLFVKLSQSNWTNRIVNRLSASSLSVYLISSHPLLLYPLWSKVLNISQLIAYPAVFFACNILLCVLVVFVCIGIDKLLECIGKMFKVDKVYEAANNSTINRAINDSK